MEKEEKKSNNTVIAVVITILVMLVIGLGGFIGYDKLINKTDTESTTTNNESKGCDCPEVVEEEKGKCPFTKLDSSYVLTDQDRDEIIESLSHFSDDLTLIKDSIKVVNHSENNYYLYIHFETTPKIDGVGAALIMKVNGKFKVIDTSTSHSYDTMKIKDDFLETICG